jgi:protein SCO1/2
MIHLLKNSYCLIIIALICFGCNDNTSTSTMPFINKPDFTPEWINKKDSRYNNIHFIPSFSFINQNSEIVTEKTVEGKFYVANFFFTKCAGICPLMTANMRLLQNHFKNDNEVLFLSHTVTPDIDSVPELLKYAKSNGIISGKWHIVTGKESEIYKFAKKEYFAGDTIGFYQKGNEFLHTENFILIDKKRRIRGVYNGTLPLEMERLIEDIGYLKKED